MSFSRRAIQRYKELAPSTDVVFLQERVARKYRDGTLPTGVAISGIDIDYIRENPEYVELTHQKGGKVHVWTVDAMADVDLCVELGVEAIISNRPGEVLAHLKVLN
jgi:glycerophosphoryl diester phosphodiesterase